MSEHEISQDILIAEYEAVYYYVLSLCHNSSEAEDITQETFCRALYKKTEFKGNSSIYTWLCAIARNIWLKKIKKEKRNVSDEVLFRELEWNGETCERLASSHFGILQIYLKSQRAGRGLCIIGQNKKY